MAKVRNCSKYGNRYRKAWEEERELKAWIQPAVGNGSKAACTFCKCEIRAYRADLLQHAKTEKHVKNAAPLSSRGLADIGVPAVKGNVTVQQQELKYACFVACHCAVSTVDHLWELTAAMHNEDIRLHRTKCTALICNVLAPCLLEELVQDISKVPYSLIVDESTDVSSTKQLCVVVRYFSRALNRMVSTFLGLIDLESETADGIASSVLGFLKKLNLDFSKCIGIGTDGCNVMIGTHDSVYSNLREVNADLQLVKCVCHSLQLCASKAVEQLPQHLEFLVGRSYSWFSHSAQRQRNYANLYRTIHAGQEPLRLVRLSNTRWLSMYNCCERVLSQWDELKLHFDWCKFKENCYDAEVLASMYHDDINRLYLHFLTPILQQFHRINKLFQLESGNRFAMQDSLLSFFRSLLLRFVSPAFVPSSDEDLLALNLSDASIFLPVAAVDFGAVFRLALQELKVDETKVPDVKNHCLGFLIEAAKQIQNRLPENTKLWRSLTSFSPSAILSQVKQPLYALELIKLFRGDIGMLDLQYKSLSLVQWKTADDTNPEALWREVYNFRDASGDRAYGTLALFALSLLALPLSNADVERVFSQVKVIKSKTRNRMATATLSAILQVRYGMGRQGVCCTSFVPGSDMLKRFNENLYGDNADQIENEELADITNCQTLF
ncbi:uncharacterized protein LOC115083609 [Rhinatrema bivittatum]|uniref:uncharacterized protein LOC115083609 n=1 Tax=Rhinatrema bivittatum TaxID=194408 RepID=UPI001129DF3C|nr:uncharacterized protein LOC115083609 [Rhinatrema bivittatum]